VTLVYPGGVDNWSAHCQPFVISLLALQFIISNLPFELLLQLVLIISLLDQLMSGLQGLGHGLQAIVMLQQLIHCLVS
jgi:hypothetical protein